MQDEWHCALVIFGGALSGAVVTLSKVQTHSRKEGLWLLARISASVFGLCYGFGVLLHEYVKIPHPWSESTAAFLIAATVEYHDSFIKGIIKRFTK